MRLTLTWLHPRVSAISAPTPTCQADGHGGAQAWSAAAFRRTTVADPAVSNSPQGVGGGGSVTMRVPGACTSLLEALVRCGFRIGDPTLFMASRPFGRPKLYLPSGPILY
jgi:hypothetical protein